MAATRPILRKERMRRKKSKLVKRLKVCTKISEDVKYLDFFSICTIHVKYMGMGE
jgi:hypothetical protein